MLLTKRFFKRPISNIKIFNTQLIELSIAGFYKKDIKRCPRHFGTLELNIMADKLFGPPPYINHINLI